MKKTILIFICLSTSYLGFSQVWSRLGNGYYNGIPSCFSSQEKLYLGLNGTNVAVCGVPADGICSFDGVKVDTMLGGVRLGYPYGAEWYNGKLIVAGQFPYVGHDQFEVPFTVDIASYDTVSGWSSITPLGGCNNPINCINRYGNNLYVGGQFTQINGVNASRIAKWNGTTWTNVGGGFYGACWVYCMAVYHNQLYVGGEIGLPNGPNNNYYFVARWNGAQWDSVGVGLNSRVHAFVVDTVQDVLYAAGEFTASGSTLMRGVARWNDTAWTPVGSGTDTLWGTNCLAIYNGELYGGGGNTTITVLGDTLNNIYKFNGIKWVGVDGGANNAVEQMCTFQGNLYVGGYFYQVGNGINASHIACYGTTCPTSVGIAEQIPPVPFKIFPNPNEDILHIESEEPNQLVFRLRNMNGQLIEEKIFSCKLDYSIKHFAAGTYFVEVGLKDGSRIHVEKLVVK